MRDQEQARGSKQRIVMNGCYCCKLKNDTVQVYRAEKPQLTRNMSLSANLVGTPCVCVFVQGI